MGSSATGVALVGFGYWGRNLSRCVAADSGLELVVVADARPDRLEQAEADYPGVRACRTVDEALSMREVGALVIATPADTHAALACAALASGRHVLVEKPLALTPPDAARIVEEARARRLVAMTGHTFLYSPAVERARELVTTGAFGNLRYADCKRLLGQARTDCSVLWDLGAHDVSILLHLLGELPIRVSGRLYSHMSIDHADTCYANLEWSSGFDASLHVSWVNPIKVRHLTLVGTRRMGVYDDVPLNQKLTVHGAGLDEAEATLTGVLPDDVSPFGRMDLRTSAGDIFIPGLAATEPLSREVNDFSRACAGLTEPVASAEFGLKVVTVLEAIERAAAEEREIELGTPSPAH